MFRSNENDMLVNSKKILVKPQVAQIYSLTGANNQVRFRLNPDSIPFFIPDRTYLKMELLMKGDYPNFKPCASAGAHSLVRNLRVTSDGQEVETVQEYNSLVAMKYARNKTDSLSSKRTLFEGQSPCNTTEQQLYVDDQPVPSATATTTNPNYKTVDVELPVHSGFFQRKQLHPNVVMPLDLVFNLEDKRRALQQITPAKDSFASAIGTLQAVITGGTAITSVSITGFDTKNLGFFVGEELKVQENSGSASESLGNVVSYELSSGNLKINLASITPTGSFTTAAKLFIDSTNRATNLDMEISNISLVMTTVSPPKDYIENLLKAAKSEDGQQFQIQTFELQRTNMTAPAGLQSLPIPNQTYDKALSVFSIPFDTTTLQSQNPDTLKGNLDVLNNYQYIHGNEPIPSRVVDTSYYLQNNRWSAIHQNELLKCYDNANVKCLDLHRIPETGWLVGRAWSDRNTVADLSKEPLFLNLEYASSSTMNKIVYHYMACIRIVKISASGVTVN